ncbi:MAG: NAD(P)/FAD-dependent oxidoreductase [Verrucomicrobiales bacterium]
MAATTSRKKVVVLGGGFAGLTFCKGLRSPRYEITLVDRQNHHLFQPLLYQVATAALSAPDIAQPLRSILADHANVTTLMDEVESVDLSGQRVRCHSRVLDYDYLVIALGARTGYFGHDNWEAATVGLKSLDDAMEIRRRVLLAFERAEASTDAAEIERLLTFVVVGGGPTGVEMAGALAELAGRVMERDFRRIDPAKARIHLIESGPRLLSMFAPQLADYTVAQLARMGVTVHLNSAVKEIGADYVVAGTNRLGAGLVLWAAGVEASGVTRGLPGIPLDRAGRIEVQPDLSLPGHPQVFAAGDIVSLVDKNGIRVPGVAPAAIQMGRHIARLIEHDERFRLAAAKFITAIPRPAFAYFDKGIMATIGRSHAVAAAFGLKFRGFVAWLMWLFIHLMFLVGFRNKASVVFQWVWSYLTWQRGARIILGKR